MLRIRVAVFVAIAVAATGLARPESALAESSVPVEATDSFGEPVTLAAKTIIYVSGSGTWDTAYDTLVDSFKKVKAYLDQTGLAPAGPGMTIYTALDDTGFNFQAGIPVATAPAKPPEGALGVGTSPDGKALRFVHRGSYDATVATYDAITHYLDEKQLEAQDILVEEYVTDLASTPDDKLVINILIPLK
jgi:effector-binding domain-containing protein